MNFGFTKNNTMARKTRTRGRHDGATPSPSQPTNHPGYTTPPSKRKADAALAVKIRTLRNGLGLSGSDLGFQIGKSQSRISKWENCEGHPTARELLSLARVFRVSLEFSCDPEITDVSQITPSALNDDERRILELANMLGYNRAKLRLLGVNEDASQDQPGPTVKKPIRVSRNRNKPPQDQ
jgi:transcriptional regulator with XRE-family HTH domain